MGCLEHWGLAAPPFADDDVYVPLARSETALAKLRFGATDADAAALAGPPGVGKSLLVRKLVAECAAAGWLAVYLPRPAAAPGDWLARLDPEGKTPRRPGQSDFSVLEDSLRLLHAAGRRVLVAVDDLQTARDAAAADLLRALRNVTVDGRRTLHLILAGQTGWWDRAATLDGPASLCAVRVGLGALSPEECRFYLLARLTAAGAARGIMTRKAADILASAARGVPRDLNRLADLSLMTGFGLDMRKITPDLAEMAVADLGLPDAAADPLWPALVDEDAAPPPAAVEPVDADILAALAAELPACEDDV